MRMMEWIVIIGGIAAIIWINRYFFLAQRPSASATIGSQGIQEIDIAVEGGYQPAVVHVRNNRPVRLVFERRERSSCSEEVVIPEFGIRRFLPPFQNTTIDLLPTKASTFPFTCGMSMLRGQIIVQD